ncbi:MAG: hypothetical protein FGM35_05040 [Rhodocyclaceae bacterium]|nr:hypothetical protein [Rhodocyclaceae bacterium]
MIQQKPKETPTPKNVAQVAEAVKIGRAVIAEGKTKVVAVNAMYPLIKDEPREIIWKAFEEGASLTPKGAITYLYNVIKEFKKKPK